VTVGLWCPLFIYLNYDRGGHKITSYHLSAIGVT